MYLTKQPNTDLFKQDYVINFPSNYPNDRCLI